MTRKPSSKIKINQKEIKEVKKLVNMVKSSNTPRSRAPKRRRNRIAVDKHSTVVRAPASAGVIYHNGMPTIESRDKTVCIRNTEFLYGFATTAAFTAVFSVCVPFNMPWLLGIAGGFGKYRWKHLRYIYIPTCPTTTQGNVSMGLNYDTADSVPTTTPNMSMYQGFTSVPYWAGWDAAPMLADVYHPRLPGAVIVDVDVDRFDKPWYPFITSADYTTVTTARASDGNIYAPASLIIATEQGPVAPVGAGRVFVQYDIELIEPILVANNF